MMGDLLKKPEFTVALVMEKGQIVELSETGLDQHCL